MVQSLNEMYSSLLNTYMYDCFTVKMVSWEKTLHVKPVLRLVHISAQSHVFNKQDMFKCHVFLQGTNLQVMFLCKTLGFVWRVSWSHFCDMSGLRTCLCVLDCVLSGSIFFYFYCLRHVYCQNMSNDTKTPFLQCCCQFHFKNHFHYDLLK